MITLILLYNLLLSNSADAYSPSQHHTSDGHSWIISKAIDHLKRTWQSSRVWPLDSYFPWLIQGSWYADHTGSLDCTWTFGGTHDCDAIHHYGRKGDIHSKFGVTVGNTGAFAAAEYTQMLFDQAVRFYPGGDSPNLKALSYRYGGRAEHLLETTELGKTYVGGLPFCERWVFFNLLQEKAEDLAEGGWPYSEEEFWQAAAQLAQDELDNNPGYCPKWPYFISDDTDASPLRTRYQTASEGMRNAMLYLGWAVHVMQDITVPQNAGNFGDQGSEAFEKRASELMRLGKLAHLPMEVGGPRTYLIGTETGFPAEINTAITSSQSIQQLVTALLELTKKNFSFYPVSDGGYMLRDGDGLKEQIIDAAILLTAEVIKRYFMGLLLPQDIHEPNDKSTDATIIQNNADFPGLSIHSPQDLDRFDIVLAAPRSRVIVDINFDATLCGIAAMLDGRGSQYPPQKTTSGLHIDAGPIQQASYRLKIYSTSLALCQYDLKIEFDEQPLRADFLEPNYSAQTARIIFAGDYDQLNIQDATDQDWFKLEDAGNQDEFTASLHYDSREGKPEMLANGIAANQVARSGAYNETLEITGTGSASGVQLRITASKQVKYSLHTSIRHCVAESVNDCDGNCISSIDAKTRIGDGKCDNGQYGINLACSQLNDDGGDCVDANATIRSSCGPLSVYDCSRRCQQKNIVKNRLGDGFCDDGGRHIDLACSAYDNDSSDCDSVSGNNSCTDAVSIIAGSSINGSIAIADEVDWYRVDVSGFKGLTIETVGSTDTYGALFAACNDPELKSDDNSGDGNNFWISLLASGTYYIRVSYSDTGVGGGNYKLRTRVRPML